MRNKNTFGPLEYIWNNFYLSVLLFILYRSLLFCPVFGLSYTASMVLFALSVALSMALGVFLTQKERRNCTSLLCNLALSFGVYFTVSFWSVLRSKFLIAGIVALVISSLYCLLVLNNYIQDTRAWHNTAKTRQWIHSCLLGCRTLVSLVLAFLLLTISLRPLFGLPLVTAGRSPLSSVTNEEVQTVEKNADTLMLLKEEEWHRLDAAKRLAVMQTVANIEADHLGIPSPPVYTKLLEETTLGQFDATTKGIALNIDHLVNETAETMLLTVCHECYHAYQQRLVDLYSSMDDETKELLLFQDARCYKNEFDNYIHGSEDYESYSSQWCEIDSDNYARSAAAKYFSHIYDSTEEAVG